MSELGRLPVVAIIGRPNVGKSSLFNQLCNSRISIEDAKPGTTRDRVSFHLRIGPRQIELVDAAGVGMIDEKTLESSVEEQIGFAIEQADVLMVVVDIKEGILSLDEAVARELRGKGKPVVLAANKADAHHMDGLAGVFHKLGLGEPISVSARQQRGIEELREAIVDALPPRTEAESLEPPSMKLAIVGKRNSGKSSIVNALARDKRVIVNELPGTTRDSVDVHFDFKGAQFVAIDTAGIQRGRSVANSVEFFSQARSLRAVRRADVVVLMMDCQETTTRLDRKLIDEAHEHLRPVIIAVNKWDLATNIEPERFTKYVSSKLPMLSHAPIVFCSAKTGLNVFNIAELAIDLHRQAHTRVSTGELNRTVAAAFDQHKPKARGGKPPKLFYATQTEVNPATIVCFVNDRELFRDEWREYLKNRLRQTLPIKEVPIKIIFRNRQKVVLEHQE